MIQKRQHWCDMTESGFCFSLERDLLDMYTVYFTKH
jgi:hypothetical protein